MGADECANKVEMIVIVGLPDGVEDLHEALKIVKVRDCSNWLSD